MSAIGALQLILLAALAFALFFGAIGSVVVPLVVSHTRSWSPVRRHRALFIVSLAPLLLAGCALIAVLLPSLLAAVWPEYDHCLLHDDHHIHLCLVHWPHSAGNLASWLVLSLLMLWPLTRTGRGCIEVLRLTQWAAELRTHATPSTRGPHVLPMAAPLCLMVGIVRPILFISQGLLARVSAPELAVILHHEQAHATRQDVLFRLIARITTAFMAAPARTQLLGTLELAAEQSCDEVAAARVGDRVQVAETILKVERLLQVSRATASPLAVAFGGNSVVERVSSLLAAPKHAGNLVGLAAGFVILLSGVLAASMPLHHLTESLLGVLTH